MKKKILLIVFILICIIHFLLLHLLGISFFTTTLLFYFLFYILIKKAIESFIKDESKTKIIKYNLKVVLIIFLITEFSCTFIFKYLNNYVENKTGVFFSIYMRNKQVDFFHSIGKIRARNDWAQGYEPYITHTHQSKDFNYNVTFNSLGLRGKLPAVEKDSNEFRIVVLGDSYIEGFGAQENETFPLLLERYLTNSSKKISVINGGICGSNPYYEVNLYKKSLEKYQADLVLVETNLTDTDDFVHATNQGKMPVLEYFRAISHIVRIIDVSFQITRSDFGTNKRETRTAKKIIYLLTEFQRELAASNQQLAIIYLPHRAEVSSDEISAILKTLKNSDLTTLDLRATYKDILPKKFNELDDYYWKNDGHHTPKGYDLMAKTVAEQLIQKKIIK